MVALRRAGFRTLPFVLLNASSPAVFRRIGCCLPIDIGSLRYGCPDHSAECVPGCQQVSHNQLMWVGGVHPPEDLRGCLNQSKPWLCHPDNVWCRRGFNEIILDRSRRGAWPLHQMVVAVGIAKNASSQELRLAREVHSAVLSSQLRVPLLSYDRHAHADSFAVLDPPWNVRAQDQ